MNTLIVIGFIYFMIVIAYLAGVLTTLALFSNKKKEESKRKVYTTQKKIIHNFDNPLKPFKSKFLNDKGLYEPVKPHSGLKIKEENNEK